MHEEKTLRAGYSSEGPLRERGAASWSKPRPAPFAISADSAERRHKRGHGADGRRSVAQPQQVSRVLGSDEERGEADHPR